MRCRTLATVGKRDRMRQFKLKVEWQAEVICLMKRSMVEAEGREDFKFAVTNHRYDIRMRTTITTIIPSTVIIIATK